jgi:ligand-binding sensor domain-containing protein
MERRAASGTQAKACATLLLLACCPCASALNPSLDISQYAHTAWTARESSFKGHTYAIAQTPDGYLWLGTDLGLLRFDGVRYVPWQPPKGERLPSNSIRRLLAARDGRLWIGTTKGLASWKDGKLIHYPELVGQSISSILEDRKAAVWAGGSGIPTGRLCAIRNGSVECYGEDGSLGQWVTSLYEDRDGNLWVGAEAGLWQWEPSPPRLYPLSKPVPEVLALNEADNGALLIATSDGIRQLASGKVEAYSLPGASRHFTPARVLRDANGGLWIGTTDHGLVHVHQGRTDMFAHTDGLSGDAVQVLFEDREGNVWAATLDGLDRFRDFTVPTISVNEGLSNAVVWSVLAARDGSMWLGTRDGLTRWNGGQMTIYRKRDGLPHDYAESLFQDDRGRIWVSTPRGLAYFENGRFIPQSAVPDGYTYPITGGGAGDFWISQDRGLFHLIDGDAAEQIPWANLGHKDYAVSLVSDRSRGGLWLGFVNGGVAYFRDGQVRASYAVADGLGEGRVTDLQLDGRGTLWQRRGG